MATSEVTKVQGSTAGGKECNKHHLIALQRVANVATVTAAAMEAMSVFMISLFNIKALGSTLGNNHRTPQCTLKIHIVLPFASLSLEPCHFCGLQGMATKTERFTCFVRLYPTQGNGSFLCVV